MHTYRLISNMIGRVSKFTIKPNFDLGALLSSPTLIKELVASEGIALNHCLYIGDTPSDIRSAHKAGATAVAYLNGYVPKFLVNAAKPDYTIRDLKELLTIIEGN